MSWMHGSIQWMRTRMCWIHARVQRMRTRIPLMRIAHLADADAH
jgi:hypothetical protein